MPVSGHCDSGLLLLSCLPRPKNCLVTIMWHFRSIRALTLARCYRRGLRALPCHRSRLRPEVSKQVHGQIVATAGSPTGRHSCCVISLTGGARITA